MTKKDLLVMLENIPDNTELRYFHDGKLLPMSTINEFREDSGWGNTVALSDVIPAKFQNRFKNN